MRIKKLFGVLVLGGATLGLGCGDDGAAKPTGDTGGGRADIVIVKKDSRSLVDTVAKDSSVLVDSAPPVKDVGGSSDSTVDSGSADLQNGGFCPNDVACDNGKVKKGFYCCWSTSC